jgi:hypothetical protein
MSKAIETKDYWTIIAMEASGHIAKKITVDESDGRNTVLVYSFGEDADEDYELWMLGAIGPKPEEGEEQSDLFEVIRKVQQSATKFKNNLHRYCR